MRHRVHSKNFGRRSAHRAALMASLVCALIRERKIETTLPKARVTRSLAEKMMTLAKNGTLFARRRAIQVLGDNRAVKILFTELAPNFKDRNGGYCRIIKTGTRRGDAASMAIVEWLGLVPVDRKKKAKVEEEKKK